MFHMRISITLTQWVKNHFQDFQDITNDDGGRRKKGSEGREGGEEGEDERRLEMDEEKKKQKEKGEETFLSARAKELGLEGFDMKLENSNVTLLEK